MLLTAKMIRLALPALLFLALSPSYSHAGEKVHHSEVSVSGGQSTDGDCRASEQGARDAAKTCDGMGESGQPQNVDVGSCGCDRPSSRDYTQVCTTPYQWDCEKD